MANIRVLPLFISFYYIFLMLAHDLLTYTVCQRIHNTNCTIDSVLWFLERWYIFTKTDIITDPSLPPELLYYPPLQNVRAAVMENPPFPSSSRSLSPIDLYPL